MGENTYRRVSENNLRSLADYILWMNERTSAVSRPAPQFMGFLFPFPAKPEWNLH